MKDVAAHTGATVTLRDVDGAQTTVPLYSEEGWALVSVLSLKQMAEFKKMYEPTWLGIPIIQVANDIIAMQELLWRIRPDAIVEIGVAHGGSLVLYASICELIGNGRVLGIDIEIRQHNRTVIEAHPLAHRISLFEGSSVGAESTARAREFCRGAETVLVVLDSGHTAEHVFREIELYHPFVTRGSYLVVMDGAQAYVSDIPRGKAGWRSDNPLTAIRRFLAENSSFEPDPYFTRHGVTSCPEGFLRRRDAER